MIYRYLINPMLNSSHLCAASLIDENDKVLDVACGIGTLSLMVAKLSGTLVTGIDIESEKIELAKKYALMGGYNRANFIVMDATDLSPFGEKEFDTGLISMAMHQFTPAEGKKVLWEMKRVCSKIIVVDYAWPIKPGFPKWLTQTIEWIAGGEHYRNFKQYMKNGGIDSLLSETGLTVKEQQLRGQETIRISLCI